MNQSSPSPAVTLPALSPQASAAMLPAVSAGAPAAAPATFDFDTHTFLVGSEIALRPITTDDAPWTSSWRGLPFPVSTATTETWIDEKIGGDAGNPYLIVRRGDGRPVGMFTGQGNFPSRQLRVFIDPLFGVNATRWTIEAYALLVPWLIEEKHQAALHVALPDDQPEVIAALIVNGWQETARFSGLHWSAASATWVDRVMLEYLNPQWVALLGDPQLDVLERTGAGVPRPVPAVSAAVASPDPAPKQAVMIGARVYLRPLNKDDAVTLSEWTRQETDGTWSTGRRFIYPVGFAGANDKLQEDELQTWIRFAVCLRETDEVIGSLGLVGVNYLNGSAETESEINRPDYRERGYGSEAKHLLLEYAFDRLGLRAVHSWVGFVNTRSAAALRKQGYTEAGRMNWAYPNDGGFGNAVVFSLFADDWRAMPRVAS